MSSDSTYLVSALEGYGTSTTEKFYEVKPGDSHLRPFTDFLVEKIGNSIPGLWPAKDSLQIITNIENLQGVELTAQNETVRLTGLNGLDLDKDEYVGIFPNLRSGTWSFHIRAYPMRRALSYLCFSTWRSNSECPHTSIGNLCADCLLGFRCTCKPV